MEHISGVIKAWWGSDYTLVTGDGVPLEDSPATHGKSVVTDFNNLTFTNTFHYAGLAFWKCPRRKLYSVPYKDTEDIPSSSKWQRTICIDSDDDDFEPRSKKRKEDRLDMILGEISSIKNSLADIFSVNENSRIPLGLKRSIRDTFMCAICHSTPIRPPVIATRCCKAILGCEQCVNSWYSGPDMLSKTCPSCRAERGCNETMVLR